MTKLSQKDSNRIAKKYDKLMEEEENRHEKRINKIYELRGVELTKLIKRSKK